MLNNWGGVLADGQVGPGPDPARRDVPDRRPARATGRSRSASAPGPLNLDFHVDYAQPALGVPRARATLTEDLIPIFNAEMRRSSRLGARMLQLDDLGAWMPLMTGNDADAGLVVDVVNRTLAGVDAKIGWHFCLGNAYGNANVSVWGGMLERILPPLYDTIVDQFVLDFALRDMRDVDDPRRRCPTDKEVAAGVVDVRSAAGGVGRADRRADAQGARRRAGRAASGSRPTAGCAPCRASSRFEKLKSMRAAVEIVRERGPRARRRGVSRRPSTTGSDCTVSTD